MHVIGKEVINGCFNLRVLQSGEEKFVQLCSLNEDNAEMIKIIEGLTEVLPLPSTVYGKSVHGWSALFATSLERARKGYDIQRYKGSGGNESGSVVGNDNEPRKSNVDASDS